MRYSNKPIVAGLVVMAVAVLAGEERVRSEPAGEQSEPVLAIVYRVADLAVWRLDGRGNPEFDATVIIAYIKDHVCPGAWNDSTAIVPSAKNAGLVVLQTRRNHERIQRALHRLGAFAAGDAADRLAKKLADAEIACQRLLLFAADPNSDATRQFFEARLDEGEGNEDLQKALAHYIIQCVRGDQTDLFDDWGLTTPGRNGATLAILSPEGNLVTEAAFDDVARDGTLNRSRLAELLQTHRIALPDAREELTSALAEAARDDRRVLVQVSGPGCGPCISLARYLESRQDLIAKDYVYLKLDTRMPKAAELIGELRQSGKRGVPWLAILSAEGQVLVAGDSKGWNIGYPRNEKARAHFEHMLRTTCQRLSDAEIAAIVEGL
jgi:hypothetical protein